MRKNNRLITGANIIAHANISICKGAFAPNLINLVFIFATNYTN